jgi:hypothetical protein
LSFEGFHADTRRWTQQSTSNNEFSFCL